MNTTVERIAERAATGKATVYRWWTDKRAVIADALRETISKDIALPNSGDLHQDLRVQLRSFFRLLQGHRGRVLKVFILEAQNDAQIASIFRSVWREAQ